MTPDVVTTTYSWGSIRCDRSKADRLGRGVAIQAYDKDGDPIPFASALVIYSRGDRKWYTRPGPRSARLRPAEARANAHVLLVAANECDMRNQAPS